MAHITTHRTEGRNLFRMLAAPFVSIFNGLVWLAEINPKYKALQRLSQMTDAELAERGLRRDAIVQHVLGPRLL